MNRSDFRCLALLSAKQKDLLSAYEIYRACAAAANNNVILPEEADLNDQQRTLLSIRRAIHRQEYTSARESLLQFEATSALLQGDRSFLLAALAHREGLTQEAGKFFDEAARHFESGRDLHRKIRALINARICENNLDQYSSGALYALQQEALRNEFHDLVGIIQKGRTGELLSRGRFKEAAEEGHRAISSITLDGCPEDLAVAQITTALAQLMVGDINGAKANRDKIYQEGGKLNAYIQAYDTILKGKKPALPKGHPLEPTPWALFAVKANSIPGKLLRRLQRGPATPDELIEEVWGKNARYVAHLTLFGYFHHISGNSA